MKTCGRCGIEKPLTEFRYRNYRGTQIPRSHCGDCLANQNRERRKRPEIKRQRHLLHTKTKYGLTPDQFDAMVLESEGRCEVCDKELRRFHIDHEHKTGAVRGLVCPRCNLIIGMLETSMPQVKAAIAYIRKHRLRGSSRRR